jgi:hypothetical protein
MWLVILACAQNNIRNLTTASSHQPSERATAQNGRSTACRHQINMRSDDNCHCARPSRVGANKSHKPIFFNRTFAQRITTHTNFGGGEVEERCGWVGVGGGARARPKERSGVETPNRPAQYSTSDRNARNDDGWWQKSWEQRHSR